jgi:hypothetical protein
LSKTARAKIARQAAKARWSRVKTENLSTIIGGALPTDYGR